MAKPRKPLKKKWMMPAWMEPFRSSFRNTGGNRVEDLLNGDTDPFINLPLSMLEFGAKCQVSLLMDLEHRRMLTTRPDQIPRDNGNDAPSRRSSEANA